MFLIGDPSNLPLVHAVQPWLHFVLLYRWQHLLQEELMLLLLFRHRYQIFSRHLNRPCLEVPGKIRKWISINRELWRTLSSKGYLESLWNGFSKKADKTVGFSTNCCNS